MEAAGERWRHWERGEIAGGGGVRETFVGQGHSVRGGGVKGGCSWGERDTGTVMADEER